MIGRTLIIDDITHLPISKTYWAFLKPFKIPNFDLSFGHLFKDKDYFLKLQEKQIIEKNLLKEQLAALRNNMKNTDKILASLPANPKQTEGLEGLDIQAGLRQKKALITSHVDEYAVVDLHAGPREMDDAAAS